MTLSQAWPTKDATVVNSKEANAVTPKQTDTVATVVQPALQPSAIPEHIQVI